MGLKAKVNGTVTVKTNEEIWESKEPLIAVPVSQMFPMEAYDPGTKAGFPCSICSQDCILAPSGQEVEAAKVNPIICMECLEKIVEQEKSGEN